MKQKLKNILENIKLSFSAVHLLGGINFGEKKKIYLTHMENVKLINIRIYS